MLGQIVALLHAEGLTHQDKNTVGAKITAIEGQFRKAKEWLANTGQGLQKDGNEVSIKKYLNEICPNLQYHDEQAVHICNITSDNLESPQPSRHV
jgi:bifunctional pyridoxal-dependent enzyme with beta-cystathionase and maltose regulon repressor activities